MGNLFILDSWNNRVRKVNTNGIITTVAGNGSTISSGDGGQATAAGIYRPTSLVFDALGNMLIADCYGNKIRKVNTLGIISTIAGNGTAAFSGDGGLATAAELNQPISLLFDASWNLYITDYHNNRIRKINTAGIITTVAGNGTGAFSGDGGLATTASINNPVNFEKDIYGNIYFSDYLNNRIRKINTAGIITTIVGNGTASYSGDGGQATAAELNQPLGIAFDTYGNLFIADFLNNRIRKVSNVGSANGIEQLTINDELINLYPNPNNGNFTIETTEKQSIQIVDINGRVVLSQNVCGKTNIDAQGLNKGIYTLNIIGIKGIINKKLVILE